MRGKLVKYKYYLLISIVFFTIGTFGQVFSKNKKSTISNQGLIELFHQVLYQVENNYVEEKKKQDLWFGAIDGLLAGLDDPHTRFMDPDEFKSLTSDTRGRFGGLGIEITMRDEILTVISPIEGTPAMRAGIEPGDQILEIEDKSTRGLSLIDAVKIMRGKPGTSVKIGVKREGEDELLYFDIIRGIIRIETVTSDVIQPNNIGYIKLKQFSQPSYSKLKYTIRKFKKDGIKRLILDLRWNPGGLLDSAYQISNLFIDKGVIVSTKGRNPLNNKVFKADKSRAIASKIPLVILVNEGSASGSEIVTGAIKDHKRGTVIGVKTFGKGSVQQVIPLSYNTAIALTIQKYYTPSGVSIHKKGIEPNIEVKPLTFTKEDRRHLRSIKDNKLLKKFVEQKNCTVCRVYNKKSIQKFSQFLKEQNIVLSDYSMKFLLKSELNKNKTRPKYDLEFDVQLQKAIDYLSKK